MNVQNFVIGNAAQNPTGLQLLGSAVLNGASTTLSGIPARNYLKLVLVITGKGGADTVGVQFNGDNAANYSHRYSSNGAADTTATSRTSGLVGPISGTTAQIINVDIANASGVHKHIVFQNDGEIVAPTSAPNRSEGGIYWDGTAQINSVTVIGVGGNNVFGTLYVFGAS